MDLGMKLPTMVLMVEFGANLITQMYSFITQSSDLKNGKLV